MGQITAFAHLLDTIEEYSDRTQEGIQQGYEYEDKKGKPRFVTAFDIDDHLLGVLGRIAFSMYCGFMDESKMKQAADWIVSEVAMKRMEKNAEFSEFMQHAWGQE